MSTVSGKSRSPLLAPLWHCRLKDPGISLTLPLAFLSPCQHISQQRKAVAMRLQPDSQCTVASKPRPVSAHRLVEPEQNAAVSGSVGLRPEYEPSFVPLFDMVAALPHVCIPAAQQQVRSVRGRWDARRCASQCSRHTAAPQNANFFHYTYKFILYFFYSHPSRATGSSAKSGTGASPFGIASARG